MEPVAPGYPVLFLIKIVFDEGVVQRTQYMAIDLANTRPVVSLIQAALADWISCSQIGFLLVKGDIYWTMWQNFYYRIQSESSFLDSAKYGGGPRLA